MQQSPKTKSCKTSGDDYDSSSVKENIAIIEPSDALLSANLKYKVAPENFSHVLLNFKIWNHVFSIYLLLLDRQPNEQNVNWTDKSVLPWFQGHWTSPCWLPSFNEQR